jgi:hypothetical protein
MSYIILATKDNLLCQVDIQKGVSMAVIYPSKEWEDSNTGLIFSCPDSWLVSTSDLAINMTCVGLLMMGTIKIFRIVGFERSDDPRLSTDFAAYMRKLVPEDERLRVAGSPEGVDAFGKRGVQHHWMQGDSKLTVLLVALDDFLVALWGSWIPSASHDEETESTLRQVFGSFSGKLKRAHKLYGDDEQEPQVFARGDLDNRLIGSWQYESYASIPSPGHSSGFSYSTSLWMTLWPDGRFQRGSSVAVTSHDYNSCGDMTGVTRGLTEGGGDKRGSWRVDGALLGLDFDDGTYTEYRYEVWPDSMLLTTPNGKESYWKKSS